MHRLLALLVALAALIAAPASALAQTDAGSGPNQVVVVDNPTDGTMLARGGVQIGSTAADTVTATNLAVAKSHDCTGCETRSAAFQAVVMTGDPTYVSPRNVASATNVNCDSCASFAFAFQYAVTVNGSVTFSQATRDQIDAIRHEVSQDLRSDVTYADLDLELQDLAAQFRAAIDAGLNSTGTAVVDRQSVIRQRLAAG